MSAQSASDITDTKHNLSVTGPGPVQATTETRICIFCHTPHNATPSSPLWNRTLEPRTYTVYTSDTLAAGPLAQPTGPTKLCLSCHDGTIAPGAVVNPSGGIAMTGQPVGSLSNFGLDLSAHHPVSFPYGASLPDPELASTPPSDLVFGGADEVHCTTCHDAHSDRYGKFLARDNRQSALCTTCHKLEGWSGSAHATSTASVAGILPRPPKTWPNYTQMNEWGCEVCHTPHFAATPQGLLNFTETPSAPFSCTSSGCHATDPAPPHPAGTAAPRRTASGATDIARQSLKVSAHRTAPGGSTRSRRGGAGAGRTASDGVTCSDCHDPHSASRAEADAPYASGLLRGASGVDRNGAPVDSVTYEYELCFKCHAETQQDLDHVPRVVPTTNTRLAFDPSNTSFHPVVAMGRSPSVPSIPSSFRPDLRATELIRCTDCHADDEGGSDGPHGSSFAPILRQRYETADSTPEGHDSYALCYQCHDRGSILRDVSFQKKTVRATPSGGGHSGHLAAGTPCSACHDPHGVGAAAGAIPGETGSHTHLINFDTRLVLPGPGRTVPTFTDTGTFSGSCNLVCHGVTHDDRAYP